MTSIRSKADDVAANEAIRYVLKHLDLMFLYDNSGILNFEYRGMLFKSYTYLQMGGLSLWADIYTAKIEEFDGVRDYINRINEDAQFASLFYEESEKDGVTVYDVSVRVGLRFVGKLELDADMLCCMLDDCVKIAHIFKGWSWSFTFGCWNHEKLDRLVKNTVLKESGATDTVSQDGFYSPDRSLTVSQLLSLIDECWLYEENLSMTIVSDTMEEMEGTDRILLYNVFAPMECKNGTKEESRWQRVTYIIENGPRSITITLNPQYVEYGVLHVMAGYFACGNVREEGFGTPSSHSLLLAYDIRPEKIRAMQQEYEEGDVVSNVLADGLRTKVLVWYSLFWGCRYLRRQLYADAVIYLENVFKALSKPHDESMNERLYLLAKMLGACYNRLGFYNKAFFYNELAYTHGRWDSVKEYLINQRGLDDLRYDSTLESNVERMKDFVEEVGTEPDTRDVRDFLFHTYTERLIETGKLRKAGRMLDYIRKNCPDDMEYVKETEKRLKKSKK